MLSEVFCDLHFHTGAKAPSSINLYSVVFTFTSIYSVTAQFIPEVNFLYSALIFKYAVRVFISAVGLTTSPALSHHYSGVKCDG